MTRTTLADGCWIDHVPGWVSDEGKLLRSLVDQAPWDQEYLRLFGRLVAQPRLTAWFGVGMDISTRYQTARPAATWTTELASLREELASRYDVPFNSALANLYRDGNDSVAWHADDEPTLGHRPVIASVSLGARRRFLMKPRGGGERHDFILGHGDLLVMGPGVQDVYVHAVPKTTSATGPRVNLTFRFYEGTFADPA